MKMNTKLKKGLAVLLCLAMICTSVGINILADDGRGQTAASDTIITSDKIASGDFALTATLDTTTNASINLAWDAIQGATEYQIYQKADDDENWETVAANYGKKISVLAVYNKYSVMYDELVKTNKSLPDNNQLALTSMSLADFNKNPAGALKGNAGDYYDVIYFGAEDGYGYLPSSSTTLSDESYDALCKYIDSGHGFLMGHDTAFTRIPKYIQDGGFLYNGNKYTKLSSAAGSNTPPGFVTPKDFVREGIYNTEVEFFGDGTNNYFNLLGLQYAGIVPLSVFSSTTTSDATRINGELAAYNNDAAFRTSQTSDTAYNGSNVLGRFQYAKINDTGLLTSYPFNINISQSDTSLPTGVLKVPMNHTNGQVMTGKVWMRFSDAKGNYYASDSKTGGSSAYHIGPYYEQYGLPGATGATDGYLTTNNNVGFIATGHQITSNAGGSAKVTTDEQHVLINTLFYLAQTTKEQNAVVRTAYDKKAPDMPGYTYSPDNQTITLASKDNGSTYTHYLIAKKSAGSDLKSDTIKTLIQSGLNGYVITELSNNDTLPLQVVVSGGDIKIADGTGAFTTMTKDASGNLVAVVSGNTYKYITGDYALTDTSGKEKYLHAWALDKAGNVSQPKIIFIAAQESKITTTYVDANNNNAPIPQIPSTTVTDLQGNSYNQVIQDLSESLGYSTERITINGEEWSVSNSEIKIDSLDESYEIVVYCQPIMHEVTVLYKIYGTDEPIPAGDVIANESECLIYNVYSVQKTTEFNAPPPRLTNWIYHESSHKMPCKINEDTTITHYYSRQLSPITVIDVYDEDDDGKYRVISQTEEKNAAVGKPYVYYYGDYPTYATNEGYPFDFKEARPLIPGKGSVDTEKQTVTIYNVENTSDSNVPADANDGNVVNETVIIDENYAPLGAPDFGLEDSAVTTDSTEDISYTEDVSNTDAITDTEDSGNTDAITDTEDGGDTDAISDTEDIGNSDAIVNTDTVSDTEVIDTMNFVSNPQYLTAEDLSEAVQNNTIIRIYKLLKADMTIYSVLKTSSDSGDDSYMLLNTFSDEQKVVGTAVSYTTVGIPALKYVGWYQAKSISLDTDEAQQMITFDKGNAEISKEGVVLSKVYRTDGTSDSEIQRANTIVLVYEKIPTTVTIEFLKEDGTELLPSVEITDGLFVGDRFTIDVGKYNALYNRDMNKMDSSDFDLSDWVLMNGETKDLILRDINEETQNLITYQYAKQQFTLTYDGVGNTGGNVPVSAVYSKGDVAVVSDKENLIREGYTFANWNTSASGGGTDYFAGNMLIITEDVTLYAQWDKEINPEINPETIPEIIPDTIPIGSEDPQTSELPNAPAVEGEGEVAINNGSNNPPAVSVMEQTVTIPQNMVPTGVNNVYVTLDEAGTPLGYYSPIHNDKDETEWIEVDENGTPLGNLKVEKVNPKTGASDNDQYIILSMLLTCLGSALILRKKIINEKTK